MRGTSLALNLVLANARQRPARVVLTCLAIMAASAGVIWVVSGYDTLVSRFDENARKFLGRYDLIVASTGQAFGSVAPLRPGLLEELRRDSALREVNPVALSRVTISAAVPAAREPNAIDLLVGSRPPVNGAPPLDPVLVATPSEEEPYELLQGEWLSNDAEEEAVISRGAAARLGVGVGDHIVATSISNQLRLRVVGVVEQFPELPNLESSAPVSRESTPTEDSAPRTEEEVKTPAPSIGVPIGVIHAPPIDAVYVRAPIANRINGFAAATNLLQVALRDEYTAADFRRVWDTPLTKENPSLTAIDYDAALAGMQTSESVEGRRVQAYSAAALASLASVFIIFTTLSMGVTERSRELALLRAVGLTRTQVGGVVVAESLLLAILGWIGGMLASQAILASTAGNASGAGQLGWTCVWLTGVSVAAGALGAMLLPAWQAMRVRPLDALSAPSLSRSRHWPIVGLLVGLLMMLVAPLSVFLLSIDDESRVWLYAVICYPALLVGVVMLTPAAIMTCDACLSRPVARLLGITPDLFRSQLVENLPRSTGATLALTSGLALFAATQVWGYTMLQNYLPGEWLPDAIVAFHPVGLAEEQLSIVRQTPGVRPESVVPLMVEQAKFGWPAEETPDNLRRDSAVIIGLPPDAALGGEEPLLKLDLVEGNPALIAEQLAAGLNCIVPEDFTALTGLGVGDHVPFIPPNAPNERVEYEIVGVASMPGWQWFTKFSGVRRRSVRTFAVVLADAEQVRDDFYLDRTEFFWMNFDGSATTPEIETALQAIAERDAGASYIAEGYGAATAYRPFARLTTTNKVEAAISMVSDEVIWGMNKLPLVTLAITSLAVINTMMASVRTRRWQIGVLRAIGYTRSQVARAIVAEALLMAGVAVCLSLLFGLVAGWCGVGMSRYSGMFYSPPTMHVPWASLAIGFGAATVLSVLAALWPAVVASRSEPLDLLQRGRGAM